jgi:DNA anti-recombination protein RmuC
MVAMGPGMSGKRDANFYKALKRRIANEFEDMKKMSDELPAFRKKYADILNDETLSISEIISKIEERDDLEEQKKLENNNE